MNTLTYSTNTEDVSQPQTLVRISIDSIDTGCYQTKDSTKLIACIGPKDNYRDYPCLFTKSDGAHRTWSYTYTDPEKSSFVVAIYKKKNYNINYDIGQIEIPISSIDFSKAVKNTYQIPVKFHTGDPLSICLSIEKVEPENNQLNRVPSTQHISVSD